MLQLVHIWLASCSSVLYPEYSLETNIFFFSARVRVFLNINISQVLGEGEEKLAQSSHNSASSIACVKDCHNTKLFPHTAETQYATFFNLFAPWIRKHSRDNSSSYCFFVVSSLIWRPFKHFVLSLSLFSLRVADLPDERRCRKARVHISDVLWTSTPRTIFTCVTKFWIRTYRCTNCCLRTSSKGPPWRLQWRPWRCFSPSTCGT